MTKEVLYTYLGTNGTLTTPIHLEGVPCVKSIRIKPAIGKKLTDGKVVSLSPITCPEDDVKNWKEI